MKKKELMDRDQIDEAALIMLVESNWQEFVEYSGGEDSAEMTLRVLKKIADFPDMK